MNERKLTRNAARCRKCGVVLESKHRHDFVACSCGNFVDGGLSYVRRGGRLEDLEELSEWVGGVMREICVWMEADEGWVTDCGRIFVVTEGTPIENEMRFCCFCGRPLKEQRTEELTWEED